MFRRASTAASSPEAGPTQHDSQTGAATKPVREVQAAGKFATFVVQVHQQNVRGVRIQS